MTLISTAQTDSRSFEEHWAVDDLPPFPAIALRALNLMAGCDTSLPVLCDLIRSDPAFSAAILRLANSPLIGFPKQITSILQASMLLGFRRLKSVVITIGLKAYLENSYSAVLHACWRHSVACAFLAERCSHAAHVDKDSAHTAGILHDIGRVALAASMPNSYAHVVEGEANTANDLLQREQDLCGIDHCEAGRTLVHAWGLPAQFVDVTLRHHDSSFVSDGAVSVLRPSCVLADVLGFSLVRYRGLRSYGEVLGEFPEPARPSFPDNPRELVTSVKREIEMLESA